MNNSREIVRQAQTEFDLTVDFIHKHISLESRTGTGVYIYGKEAEKLIEEAYQVFSLGELSLREATLIVVLPYRRVLRMA